MSIFNINRANEDWTEETQSTLSKWQAYPIAGPLLVSPLKAAFSLIEISVGLVAAIPLAMIGVLFRPLFEKAGISLLAASLYSADRAVLGFGGLVYSLLNLGTLGVVGLGVQRSCRSFPF